MDLSLDFQPREIVSLTHGDTRLYAEVIQVVVSRQLCWVRPLLLVLFTEDEPTLVTDLRSGSDLLWPINLFRSALDTEVIPLLSLLTPEAPSERDSAAKQQLNQFIQQVWQAHKQDDG
jgi:hypothetical protein